MSDSLTPDDPNVATQPLQLIQTSFEQLGADTSMPNVYHAVVCTQKSLQYEWRRILHADEVCSGAYTWPNGEPIQYCYFVPGVRTDAFQKPPPDQAKMEAANKVVTRVGELGEKALALVSTLGTVKGVNVTGLFTREDWLRLLYSFAWKYPGPSLSAERYRIFRPANESPFSTDPTYRELDYDVRVSVEEPSAMEHETPSMTWEHDGRVWTESFPEAFSHSFYAALTPDICAASASLIATILQPVARQPGGSDSKPNAKADVIRDLAAKMETIETLVKASLERGEKEKLPEDGLTSGRKAKYGFERDGDQWKIQFGDESTTLNHEQGVVYIAQLLQNPNQKIQALHLEGVKGKTAGAMGEDYGDGLTIQKQRDAAAGDEELLKNLRTELRGIDLELAERTKAGDGKECEIITRKRIDLLKIAKTKYGIAETHLLGKQEPTKGRGPCLSGGNEVKKAFDRVKYHIDKIKDRIEEPRYKVPGFAKHIRKHVREYGNRTGYIYDPASNEIAWVVSQK